MQRLHWLGRRFEELFGPVLLAAVAGFAAGASSSPRGAAPVPALSGAAPHHAVDDAAASTFDDFAPLRMEALQGNLYASAELASQLVARFERSGHPDDLHEGFQWIARDWDQPGFPGEALVQHIVLHHCHRAVLRWHLLCSVGE